MEEYNNSKNVLLLIILAILLIGGGYYLINELVITNNNKEENDINVQSSNDFSLNSQIQDTETEISENTSNYNINDYVLVKRIGTVENISFKSLPTELTADFTNTSDDFFMDYLSIFSDMDSDVYANDIEYSIDNTILSVYAEDMIVKHPAYPDINAYSMNINLDTNSLVSNEELLDHYNITSTELFTSVLNSLADDITVDYLLNSTTGDIAAEKIYISDFKKNIDSYSNALSSHIDSVILYVDNGQLIASFDHKDILTLLELSTYRDIGLYTVPVKTIMNK